MKNQHKTLLFWMVFVTLGLVFFRFYGHFQQNRVKNFNYPKFLQALKADQVIKDKVVFNTASQEITGELTEEGQAAFGGKTFVIQGNVDDKGFEILREHGIIPAYSNKDKSFWMNLLLNWFPLLLFVGIFIFFIRQIQAGGARAFSFGKSRARLVMDKGKATFKDVAGIEEAKEEVREIVEFLKNPKKFTKLGGEIPKGVLLIGPPGTGKTLLARAIAGEAKAPFFTISGSDFVEMFVGVGASRVRDLFQQGKQNAPCLIFVDEIDAVGRHRGAGLGGGHDEREQTLNQLLVEMDGFESKHGVILVAATNRADVLDPALLRPGRFDRRVTVSLPDLRGRTEILKVHTKKIPLSPKVDLETISRGTPGFSGADLKNLINEASLMAAWKDKPHVEMEDFEKARDKVLMGSERKSFVMTEKDKKITAYHEAGHALVGMSLPLLDPVHKVTIVPRGMALGVTQTLPKEDMLNMSREKAKNTLAFLFGGRAAEEVIFTDYTSGAGNDIEKATHLARRMVCEWGMSDLLGPLAFGNVSHPVFLGKSPGGEKDYSEESARKVDQEVSRFISSAYKKAKKIIEDRKDKLEIMVQALLSFETIDAEEIKLIMKGKGLSALKNYRRRQKTKLNKEREEVRRKNEKKSSKNDPADPVGSPAPAPV